jgi:hypothetical protein
VTLHHDPNLLEREADLLREIYRAKRPGFEERFAELNVGRRMLTLSAEEQVELLQLVEESEALTVRRLAALAELAQLRQVSLPELMDQLGLRPPAVA